MQTIDERSLTKRTKNASNRNNEPPTRIEIPPCTIILATDKPGALCQALQRRLTTRVTLRPYSTYELKEIAEHIAKSMRVLISAQAARLLARVAHGVPATLKALLNDIRLCFTDSAKEQISVSELQSYLAARGIDESGLGREHREYLRYLAAVGVAGKELMAMYLNLSGDPDYLTQHIERVLLQNALITITSRGRQLTDRGRSLMAGMPAEQAMHEAEEENENGSR
jgi:holliday junction DNA helicase RuvB